MIRRITVELAFPGESGWTDVSGLIRYPSWNIDEAAFSSEKRSTVDKFSCNLKYDATILGKLRAADARIWINVKNAIDASALFFGVIEPSVANETSDHISEISLEAVDNSWRLDEKVSITRQLPALVASPGYKLWDPADQTHSIAHVMLTDAGYSTAEISAAISNTTVIQSFSAIKDESTYRELLDVLFMEYGYVIHPDASGVLTLLPWKPTAAAIELGPEDLSTVVPFKFENRADYRDSAKVTWAELEILDGVLVYRADLPVDSEGNFTGEAIAAADFYPKDSDIEDIYQTYVQKWLDKPYLSRETRLANKDLTLVATSGAVISSEADDGIAVDINLFESHQARVRFLNSAITTGKIRIFEIYADALIRKKIGTEKALPLGMETNAREYASQYLFDKTSAQALATALAEDLYAEEQYSFGCNQVLGLGSKVKLIEARNGTSVYAVINRRKRSSSKAYIEYEAIQLLTAAGITVTSESQTMSKVWPPASEKVTPEQPLSGQILAHRSYDDADVSGAVVIDNSGAGHHATRSGGTIVMGARGKALECDETDTVDVDYGLQDISAGWTILKTLAVVSSDPAHEAFTSILHIELRFPDGIYRDYEISGIEINTWYPAGVVHNGTAAEIWANGELLGSYVCGPETISEVVFSLIPHASIASTAKTAIDEEVDAARAFTAAEVQGYSSIGMEKKFTWADYQIPNLAPIVSVPGLVPRFRGSFAYVANATATTYYSTAIIGDWIVLFSMTAALCGIYKWSLNGWERQATPTEEQTETCALAILAAVDAGYCTSTAYVSVSSTSIELLIARRILAKEIVLLASGYLKSHDYAETDGNPTAGFMLDVANQVIKAFGAKFVNATISGKATLSELVFANVTAGNNLVRYLDAEFYYDSSTPYKFKELQIVAGGQFRVKFDLNLVADRYDVGLTAYAAVYKKGTQVGTTRSITANGYVTFSEDISGFIADDLVQVYAWVTNTTFARAYVKNFRIYIAENPGILRFIGSP
jgi:hypothetical protein